MKTVSRFEAYLLQILHSFFRRSSSDPAVRLVSEESECPRCLSRNAIDLVKDTLKKGMVQFLAERGGWRRERFLRNDQIAEGRLWNRTPPGELGLSFSRHSLEFLIWITADHPSKSWLNPVPDESELTIGDRLLYLLAYESLRGTEPARGLMQQPPFKRHALLWLVYLSELEEHDPPKSWDFSPWVQGQGAEVLEAFGPRLSERWFQMERQKLRIPEPQTLRRLGTLQERILSNLFDAVEAVDRRDLCRFFLQAMKQHLRDVPRTAGPAYRPVMNNLRMADRAEVYRSAGACLRQMARMDQWNRRAQSIGFYDEGYAAAQLWKSDWEQLDGDRLWAESQARWHSLEPLGMAGNPIASPPQIGDNTTDTSESS